MNSSEIPVVDSFPLFSLRNSKGVGTRKNHMAQLDRLSGLILKRPTRLEFDLEECSIQYDFQHIQPTNRL